MGWFLRKGWSIWRLFRVNFSKRGIGVSAGVKGARIGIGSRGKYASIGRGGLYFRKSLEPKAAPGPAESPGEIDPMLKRFAEPADRLIRERPPGWEYLLFAHYVDSYLTDTRENFHEEPDPARTALPVGHVLGEIGELLGVLMSSSARITEVINVDFVTALGPPGGPADLDGLLAAAGAIGHEYLLLKDVKYRAHAIPSKSYFVPVRTEIGKSVDGICSGLDDLPEMMRRAIVESTAAAKSGRPRKPSLDVDFTIPNEVELNAAAQVAMEGAKKDALC